MSQSLFASVTARWLSLTCVAGLATACAQPEVPDARGLNTAYEQALAATAGPAAATPPAGSAAEAAMLQRLQEYFASMDAASVATRTTSVYAADAVLYDNLAVVYGVDDIEAYFTKAVTEADGLQVSFQQVARAGDDFYVRWQMAIASEALSPGDPLVSYGVTHFRFDADGRVILHRDFWDAASGLYEHLPVAGGLIYRLRNLLGAFSAPGNESRNEGET